VVGNPLRGKSRKFILLLIGGCLVVAFALIQLVPYRVDNPPVVQEPAWDSPQTRKLAVAACFDCHSNETHTQWWEDIAPGSWWITNHVKEGRDKLNFSECTKGGGENEASETVREGSMPPNYYTWLGLHRDAKLTRAQKDELAAGLDATLNGWSCGGGGDEGNRGRGGGDDD
jgi:hypothetical protein